MAIKKGVQVTLEEANKFTGQNLNPRIFDWMPQGARILMIVDRIAKQAGRIELPDQVVSASVAGTGWIVAAGPLAGTPMATGGTVGTILCDHPKDLLGIHTSFGFDRGRTLRFSVLDNDYDSPVLLLAPLDILCVDYHPDPLSVDDFELAYQRLKQFESEEAAAAYQLELDREIWRKRREQE